MSILHINGLNIEYGKGKAANKVVSDVGFTLEREKVLGIVGSSGCGKSTVARAILGILPPSARVTGKIEYHGRQLININQREMGKIRGKEISMVFQDPSMALNPIRKIKHQAFDILKSDMKNKKDMEGIIIDRLAKAHLKHPEDLLDKLPYELSGGMKQRICIAFSLLRNPKILIADEPTSAIDAAIRADILKEIQETKRENHLSIIYISHNIAEIQKISDEVVVMRNGVIVEQQPTQALFSSPKNEYTKELISAVDY